MQAGGNLSLTPHQENMLKRNLDSVLERFARSLERSGRKSDAARLVAVSKWHGLPSILAVAKHWRSLGGEPVFGENYLQEAETKQKGAAAAGEPDLTWHFTGHLQSRKARQAAGSFALIHSLDSLTLAHNLQKTLQSDAEAVKNRHHSLVQPVLVQINIGGEASKTGIAPEKSEEFLLSLQGIREIDVQGLMVLPPFSENPEDTRPYFIQLRQMRDRLESALGIKLPHLSMGMSHDFEAALEEGATLARVGTDIFGQREY